MRVLLLGGSSFVGSAVRRQPAWPSDGLWTYHAQACADPLAGYCDLLDTDNVRCVIEQVAPTHVIDTSLPARDSPAEAAFAAHSVCAALRAVVPDVRYILVSTDAVFSGAGGRPYVEYDPVSACSQYGRARAVVESIIQRSVENHCVARTCLVYGFSWRGGKPILDPRLSHIAGLLRRARPVSQYVDQYRTPTFIDDLAPALLQLLLSDVRGIIHLAGPDRASRLEFARQVARAFELDPRLVLAQALPDHPAFGKDTSLNSERARRLLGWSPCDLVQGLSRVAARYAGVDERIIQA